jgi:outer membrane protein assembly factor BamB
LRVHHALDQYNVEADVVAYDRTTGTVIWEAGLPDSRSVADLFLDHDRVYLVITGGILQIRDSATGALLKEIQGQIGRPAIYRSGILYGFNGRDDKSVAFDVRAKRPLWTGPAVEAAFPSSHPLIVGQRVLASTSSGEPMAFDAQTGTLLWAAKTGEDAYQTPTVMGDMVYILGVGSGNIYALSIQDGKELGRLRTGDKIVITDYTYNWRPVAAEGLLIVPVNDKVYAYGD